MSGYKLYYFNSRGGAEVSRLLFAAAGMGYEDCRLQGQDWLDRKPDMPLGAMPDLEIDGKKYCQSHAIERYLAKQYGFYGKNDLESLKIDEVHESVTESFMEMARSVFEKDEKRKAEMQKTFAENLQKKFGPFFERCLKADGSGFIVGGRLTLADLALFNFMDQMKRFAEQLVEGQTALNAHYSMVKELPKIKAWLDKRPETDH